MVISPFPSFFRETVVTMLTDSFEDGNVTSNPEWNVTSGAASVTTDNPRTGTYSVKGATGSLTMEHTLSSSNDDTGATWKAYFYPTVDESGLSMYQLYDSTNNTYFRLNITPQSSTTLYAEFSRFNVSTLSGVSSDLFIGYGGSNPTYPSNGWGGHYWELSMTRTSTGFTAKITDGTDTYNFDEIPLSTFSSAEKVTVMVGNSVHVDDVDYGVE